MGRVSSQPGKCINQDLQDPNQIKWMITTRKQKKVKKKLHAEKSYAGMRDNGSYILSSLKQQSKEPSKNKMLTSLGIFLVE